MANNTAVNPWIIDTASGTNVTADLVRIGSVRWVVRSAGVAGDRCLIADGSGNTIWEAVNDAGQAQFSKSDVFGTSRHSGGGLQANGVRVPTLDRGLLYIEYL